MNENLTLSYIFIYFIPPPPGRTEEAGVDNTARRQRPTVTTAAPDVGHDVSSPTSSIQPDDKSSSSGPVSEIGDGTALGRDALIDSSASTFSPTLNSVEHLPIGATLPDLSEAHYSENHPISEDSSSQSSANPQIILPQSLSLVSATDSVASTPSITCHSSTLVSVQSEPGTLSDQPCPAASSCSEKAEDLDQQTHRKEEPNDSDLQEIGCVPPQTQSVLASSNDALAEVLTTSVSLEQFNDSCGKSIVQTTFPASPLSQQDTLSVGSLSQSTSQVAAAEAAENLCSKASLTGELKVNTSCPGMAEDGQSSSTTCDLDNSDQGSIRQRTAISPTSSNPTSTYSCKTASVSSSCFSSSSHSQSQQSVKSTITSMLSSEDPGPVRRKSLDLGKSTASKSEGIGRRRHNTDMDEMVEELMRAVEDEEEPLLDESNSSMSSAPCSSSDSSPSQTSIQRIASASSLRKSTANDPYKVLERSQSDASLMRDLVMLDPEEVHLTAGESTSGQNISECNRVYLDLSRAEAFEKNSCIGGRPITSLRFADDIDGTTAGNVCELASLVDKLDKASSKFGMEISAEKTKIMTNSKESSKKEIKGKNEEARRIIENAIGPLTIVRQRKLKWYGHTTCSSGLAKTIMQGTVNGGRGRGRQKKRWEDNIREWTGLELRNTTRKAEDREEWEAVLRRSSAATQWIPNLRDR
ncbi:hypothetical protein ElyMa_006532000 [Elysia marginata]|uniref:Reverse transcriptase domain-containing protein n=1 Tax=Elysia marginata TaxID=1093978 RepID=A0AAV4I6T1_9GAST|nr:hypothetical protein ElyMa_006532000 [Elysia marginata]